MVPDQKRKKLHNVDIRFYSMYFSYMADDDFLFQSRVFFWYEL